MAKMFAQSAEKQLKWLYGLQSSGVKLGLDNIRHLLRRMGEPQKNFRTIHVAGSDGKGSTCAILASVLRASGYRVGLYTSPHILRFNERIQIDGVPISDEDMAFFASRVRHFADDMRESDINCTFFEVTTAMAFDYFDRNKVDIAVVEVGMGGRFDATNTIVPDVCIINNISLEHQEYLGDTIEKIAFEKAGIIKPGVPVVTINPEPALGVISEVAARNGSELTAVPPDIEVLENLPDGPTFMWEGRRHHVTIPGRNEAKNAAVALTALTKLPDYGERIAGHVEEGLSSVEWPCRLQDLGNGYLVDVTHTNAGSVGLAKDISEIYGKLVIVFGLLDDKDVEDISRNLAAVASKMVVTTPDCPRAKPVERTYEVVRRYFPDAECVPGVAKAIERADELRGEGEKVLICGSFYMAEEALRWMGRTSL